MKIKSVLAILITLLLVGMALGQDKTEDSKEKKEKWKYLGSAVFDVTKGINVDSYFNEKGVEKKDQMVTFQIKEEPNKPLPFFKSVFTRIYEINPDKYASFTHLITFFEGNCSERTLRVTSQEVWGTENKDEPIITFTVEHELERVRSGSSKEKDLLKACRKK